MINKDKIKGFVSGIILASLLGATAFAAPLEKKIDVLYDNIKIYVDGVLVQPKDGAGNAVEPFLSNGTTYLPVRAVSEALGKEVSWDADSKSIYIGEKPALDIQDVAIEEVTVSNADELYAALGSYKHIKLTPGVYNLSQLKPNYSESKNIYWKEVYDGRGLVLEGIEHITFEGLGESPVEIVVEPRYADVLTFINSSSISFKNIKAGHTIESGYCTGGVLNFDSCRNIDIKDSIFYGCGTYGIVANNTKNLTFDNSVIEECTYGIMTIYGSENFSFIHSKFRDCMEFSMFAINASKNIVFEQCEIAENKASSEYSTFFAVDSSKDIKFINCSFKNNAAVNFADNLSNIDFTGSTFDGKPFDR